jgi:diphosphomevalonate decarboxylase
MCEEAKSFIASKLPPNYFESKKQPDKVCAARAPVNIALVKYWGKRNIALNLPFNDSLSIGLTEKFTETEICPSEKADHQVFLKKDGVGEFESADSAFTDRVTNFVNLLIPEGHRLSIKTTNYVPTAAGLASSASGFAALVKALAKYYDWQLTLGDLSAFARIGSGSACRSLWPGFVHWTRGAREDGTDSIGRPVNIDAEKWYDFSIGFLVISREKIISSTEGMIKTVKESPLYPSWPDSANRDVVEMKKYIQRGKFIQLGRLAEYNALSMHATMIAARTDAPPVFYWLPETVAAMQKVREARKQGIEVYFTMDAGPNIKLLTLKKYENDLNQMFDDIELDWDHPFENSVCETENRW